MIGRQVHIQRIAPTSGREESERETQRLTRLKATPREILDDVVVEGVIPRVGHSPRGGSSAQRLAREVEEAPALEPDADEGDERQEILQGEPVVEEGGHGVRERLKPLAGAEAQTETECTSHGRHGGR